MRKTRGAASCAHRMGAPSFSGLAARAHAQPGCRCRKRHAVRPRGLLALRSERRRSSGACTWESCPTRVPGPASLRAPLGAGGAVRRSLNRPPLGAPGAESARRPPRSASWRRGCSAKPRARRRAPARRRRRRRRARTPRSARWRLPTRARPRSRRSWRRGRPLSRRATRCPHTLIRLMSKPCAMYLARLPVLVTNIA
jgi:hypothetical protein